MALGVFDLNFLHCSIAIMPFLSERRPDTAT